MRACLGVSLLTEVGGDPNSAPKLMNPLGATEMSEIFGPSPLPVLSPLMLSAMASAMANAPPAPPVPSQPRLRAAEAMLSATALQNPPPPETRHFLFRIGLTFDRQTGPSSHKGGGSERRTHR